MEISMLELAKEIVGGRRLTREEDCSFLLEADINELCEGADYIRKNLCGTRADLCAIINGKSGACSENCKFCSQSAHHHTACQAGDFIDEEAILSGCREAWEQGVDRYCIVTAGRAIKDEDFEKALHAYKKMHEEFPDMILCASHGFVSERKIKTVKRSRCFQCIMKILKRPRKIFRMSVQHTALKIKSMKLSGFRKRLRALYRRHCRHG